MSTYLPNAIFPTRLFPSILFPLVTPVVDLYVGPTHETIDYATPLTSGIAHGSPIRLDPSTLPGQRFWLAMRATSPAGVTEHNTHHIIAMALAEDGESFIQPLPEIFGLHLHDVGQGSAELWFACNTRPGYQQPEGFEVLIDDQAGHWQSEPLIVLDKIDPVSLAYRVDLPIPHRPGLLAVRSIRSQLRGPISSPLAIQAIPTIATPRELTTS